MKKQDKILKKVSPLSKNVKAKSLNKKNAAEKHFLPDHHFKNVKVKKGINGLGLFAGEDIKKGELIIEYIGNILTDKETDKIPDSRYIFSISKNHNIDGTPRWNLARYCNHSCDGNAESEVKKKRVFMRAIKDIKAGEEIVYDYGEEYFQEFLLGKCMCGAEKHLYSEVKDKNKKEKFKLNLHSDKVFIKSIYSGIDFLGWIHFPKYKVLRTATKKRMFRKLKENNFKNESVQSYLGLLRYGNTFKIKNKIYYNKNFSDDI